MKCRIVAVIALLIAEVSAPIGISGGVIGAHGSLAAPALTELTPSALKEQDSGMLMPSESALRNGPAASKPLFCAYGPDRASSTTHVVMVVELDSPNKIDTTAVSAFALLTAAGVETSFTRILNVEEFLAELDSTKMGINARYMNPGTSLSPDGVRPWDGALPKGIIRLRIRVASADRGIPRSNRCRVVIGPHTVEGPVNGGWAGL